MVTNKKPPFLTVLIINVALFAGHRLYSRGEWDKWDMAGLYSKVSHFTKNKKGVMSKTKQKL